MMEPRVLFVCKRRNDKYGVSFGLINSCNFVCNTLKKHGIPAETVMVIDNNYIDREVFRFKPTHVFIEALWVVPDKFHILIPRYPNTRWYVRLHSRMPFLANEGIAVDWLKRYHEEVHKKYPKQFFITSNNRDLVDCFHDAFDIPMDYHPNIYNPPHYEVDESEKDDVIDVGCFGAIRPMKNQVYQAVAAIAFAEDIEKKIRFHVNANRIEQKGDPVLKNMELLFEGTDHKLVKHEWMDHKSFYQLVSEMDIGMQVSLTESFNIVAADFVWNDVPIVGSGEIGWLNWLYKAKPTSLASIIFRMKIAWYGKKIHLHALNRWGLNRYNKRKTRIWLASLHS